MTENDHPQTWPSPLDRLEPTPRPRLTATFLAIIVFSSGAAVMMYEFLAVRFLQRNFGSSLDVWAAEIAVCMAGLAAGYWLGGALADRSQLKPAMGPWRVLGKVLVVGGATGLVIEPIADLSGDLVLKVEPAWWHPLAAAAACSFVPLLALGTVMPQAVQIQVRRLDKVGATAGWIAAVSTVGSIIGVLLVTFLLLPRFGVRETLWAVSLVLMGFGILIAGSARLVARQRRGLFLFALIAGAGVLNANAQVIFEQYTAYHHILVEDKSDKRILWFDRAPQSTMSKTNPVEGAFEYTDFFHVPFLLDPTIRTAAFIGLGGGSGPKAFLRDYPNVHVDAVEIDPVVVRVARDLFSVPQTPRLTITTADGRQFLRRARGQYGTIIMDAYASGPYGAHIPYHLATREFFEIARERLTNGGSVVYNVIGAAGGMNDALLRNMHATLRALFEEVYVFQAASSLNTVFVAQKIVPTALHPDELQPSAAWPWGPWRRHPLSPNEFSHIARQLLQQGIVRRSILAMRVTQFSRLQFEPITGQILTDNYAPVDIGAGRMPSR